MKALVLSAGGMYGAYQAGAWKALADVYHPDLIVGASVGALNGWAIAGGCEPEELIRLWMNLDELAHFRWKLPRSIFGGILDSTALQRALHDVFQRFSPRIDFALVLTDLAKLQPRIFRPPEITWRHLVATTAIIEIFDQVRLDGRLYSDGGLLAAVPLWAAAELGATEAVVIKALPETPGLVAKIVVGAIRAFSRFRAEVPAGLPVVTVKPPALLGPPLQSVYWNRDNVERWILQGERDAREIKHSIQNCFEAK